MITVAELLLPTHEQKQELLTAVRDCRETTEKAVDDPKVSGAVADLLDIRISSLLAQGWSSYHKVQKAIEETRKNTPAREQLGLAKHKIEVSRPIVVKAEIAGASRNVFECALMLTYNVDPLNLQIMNGQIEQVSAVADVTATLKIGVAKVLEGVLLNYRFDVPTWQPSEAAVKMTQTTS